LDFGWSLADVLRKSKENAKNAEQNKDKKQSEDKQGADTRPELDCIEEKAEDAAATDLKEKSANEILTEEERKLCGDWMEIGTWSNDMANHDPVSVGIPVFLCFQYVRN
jgi:endoribonuclease Dicer